MENPVIKSAPISPWAVPKPANLSSNRIAFGKSHVFVTKDQIVEQISNPDWLMKQNHDHSTFQSNSDTIFATKEDDIPSSPLPTLQFSSPIQSLYSSVRSSRSSVYGSDSCGNVLVLDEASNCLMSFEPKTRAQGKGLTFPALSPVEAVKGCVSRFFSKDVVGFDGNVETFTINLPYNPVQAHFDSTGTSLYLLMNNLLCLYDVRQHKRPVQKVEGSKDRLFCMDLTDNHIIVGGAERSACVFDKRKWNAPLGMWARALKFDITSVFFSKTDPSLCFLAGLGSEFVCGPWAGYSNHQQGFPRFQNDSMWMGIARDQNAPDGTDSFVGLTTQGSIYRIDHAASLYPFLGKASDDVKSTRKKTFNQTDVSVE
eukprot:GCRY01004432.1.p1 GENE.GCRY01004432.1~~GCRY01004432.1.p1  ORF type:complete len:370 (-),score=56.58 GCRY01004432.1:244-1353(-)